MHCCATSLNCIPLRVEEEGVHLYLSTPYFCRASRCSDVPNVFQMIGRRPVAGADAAPGIRVPRLLEGREEMGVRDLGQRRFLASSGLTAAEVEARVAGAAPVARVRLRRWCVVTFEGFLCLAGVVEGHPLVSDGRWARTSPLVGLVPQLQLAVTASSRIYELLGPLIGPGEGGRGSSIGADNTGRDGTLH